MIKFIPYQTIQFKPETDTLDCRCGGGKSFCQPVTILDETQFQLKGNLVNTNPEFKDIYIGWDTWIPPILNYNSSSVTEVGLCDGSITATATGNGPFTYSIDGGEFSDTFEFDNLCYGKHLLVVIDAEGHYASTYAYVGQPSDCSGFTDAYANDVELIEIYTILECFANDFI